MHVQSVQILFFIVKYANLWGFCCRRGRGCSQRRVGLSSGETICVALYIYHI